MYFLCFDSFWGLSLAVLLTDDSLRGRGLLIVMTPQSVVASHVKTQRGAITTCGPGEQANPRKWGDSSLWGECGAPRLIRSGCPLC